MNIVLHVVLVHIAQFNTAGNLDDPSVEVQSNLPMRFIETTEFVVFCASFLLSAINKQRSP
jgi:hypothetical protein